MVWTVKVREGFKETFRRNKRGYATFTFSYAKEVQEFLKSVVSYGAKPLDLKVFWVGQ